MNVLLTLDFHTIMVGRGYGYINQIHLLEWLIQLVDNELIPIWYQYGDETSPTTYRCNILDLPNWAYSYALALFELHKAMQFVDSDDEIYIRIEETKAKADIAIQAAMYRYPSVVGCLLHKLEIDTSGRSFQRDWVTVLDHAVVHARELVRHWNTTSADPYILSSTIQSADLITKIFVEQSAKLYELDDVLQWMYDNLAILQAKETTTDMPIAPSAAIMRYANADPADYASRIQTLPPDAIIIDNGLLAHAMTMDPRRPRYIRRNNRRDGRDDIDDIQYDELGNPFLPQRASYFGPPTEAIDPDWPMTEVFLRSILPWTYVEGLPPPRR
jgi:Transcriptional repressor TCF25